MWLVGVSWPFGTGAPKRPVAYQFVQQESLRPGRKAMMCPGFIDIRPCTLRWEWVSLVLGQHRGKLILPNGRGMIDICWLSVLCKFPIHKETTDVGYLFLGKDSGCGHRVRWRALRQVIELSTSGDGLEVLLMNHRNQVQTIIESITSSSQQPDILIYIFL